MPHQANVTSVAALREFRSNLIVYVSKARPTIEEVSSDVMRTKLWLETDRQIYWENQVRRCTRKLEQANQAMFGARISNDGDSNTAEMVVVRRAKAELEAAQAKLKLVKKWIRELDTHAEPMVRQMEKLHTLLSHDMTNAIAHLGQAADMLDAYAEVAVPCRADTAATPPTTGTPAVTEGNKP